MLIEGFRPAAAFYKARINVNCHSLFETSVINNSYYSYTSASLHS